MLTCERLRSTNSPHFTTLDALYARIFPWYGRREGGTRLQALSHPHYTLEAQFDEGVFIGLSSCQQFADYGYIEHLAIDDTLRSRSYSKQLLTRILTCASLTVLEIDPPTTAITHKRPRFYQPMGFRASTWAHHHPSYHQDITDHELLVLSYPQPINGRQYQQFIRDLGCEVVGQE